MTRPENPSMASRPFFSSAMRRAWMVKRRENCVLGGLWLGGHGLSVPSETPGLFSRVRRAVPSLQMQTEEPVEASYGPPRRPPLPCRRAGVSIFSGS